MIVSVLLLLVSLGVTAFSLWLHFPQISGAALAGLAGVFAALLLAPRKRRRASPRRWVVIDGSNVMYWGNTGPDLAVLSTVIGDLQARGLTPAVWFDANVGYLIGNRYQGPVDMAQRLGLPHRQVFVAPKGTPADPLLLEGAKALNARIVSNDRYRDWIEDHPLAAEPGLLVGGRIGAEGVTFTATRPG